MRSDIRTGRVIFIYSQSLYSIFLRFFIAKARATAKIAAAAIRPTAIQRKAALFSFGSSVKSVFSTLVSGSAILLSLGPSVVTSSRSVVSSPSSGCFSVTCTSIRLLIVEPSTYMSITAVVGRLPRILIGITPFALR